MVFLEASSKKGRPHAMSMSISIAISASNRSIQIATGCGDILAKNASILVPIGTTVLLWITLAGYFGVATITLTERVFAVVWTIAAILQ
jgi:hypothetical protein